VSNDRKINIASRQLMPFGKYKGKTLGDICDDDVLYLDFLIGQDWLREPLKTFVSILHIANIDRIEAEMEAKEYMHGYTNDDFDLS
jgi:uncharacterized protein (DUF3820 family)